MTVTSKQEAWNKVNQIFPTDYMKDEQSSINAGYPIYRSTLSPACTDSYQPWYCQIADLGTRLEVTVTKANWDQEVTNIWIEEPAQTEGTTEEPAPGLLSTISPERKDLVLRLRRATFAYLSSEGAGIAAKRRKGCSPLYGA